MTFHLTSFLLGVLTIPALAALVLVVLRLVEALKKGAGFAGVKGGSSIQSGLEPLRFTPRLMGKLRQPMKAEEDHARAAS